MSLSIEETLSYRSRPLHIETAMDPSELLITSLLSTDEDVVDVRTISGNAQLDGLDGAQRLQIIQSLLEDAHRYVKTRLLSGRYDDAIDAVDEETEKSKISASRTAEEAGFSAVQVGPEAFGDPRHRDRVFRDARARIEAEIKRRQHSVGPLAPPRPEEKRIPPSASASSTQVAADPSKTREVPPESIVETSEPDSNDSAFPRMGTEASEASEVESAAPEGPNQTAEFVRETGFSITDRPPSRGCAEAFFEWAGEHSLKAAYWIHTESSSWMIKRRPNDSLQELEQTSPWKSFLNDWDRFTHQVATTDRPTTTAWVSDERCAVIVFDGDEAVTALVPSRLLGVALSAAQRIVDTVDTDPEASLVDARLPTPGSKKRPKIGGA